MQKLEGEAGKCHTFLLTKKEEEILVRMAAYLEISQAEAVRMAIRCSGRAVDKSIAAEKKEAGNG